MRVVVLFTGWSHSHKSTVVLECSLFNGLGEHVSYILLSINVLHYKSLRFLPFADLEMSNIYMLASPRRVGIGSSEDAAQVVTAYHGRVQSGLVNILLGGIVNQRVVVESSKGCIDLTHQIAEPDGFLCCNVHSNEFSFVRRASEYRL